MTNYVKCELFDQSPVDGLFDSTRFLKDRLYQCIYQDYTLITNCLVQPDWMSHIPQEIQPLLQHRWMYKLNIVNEVESSINQKSLNNAVEGGLLLGYCIESDLLFQGNDAVYFGFIPFDQRVSKINGTHATQRIYCPRTWPRRLFIGLRYKGVCVCSDGCTFWKMTVGDGTKLETCLKRIPWGNLRIYTGQNVVESQQKVPRDCNICSQCYACHLKINSYCRLHKNCRHNQKTLAVEKNKLKTIQMKQSKKVKKKHN